MRASTKAIGTALDFAATVLGAAGAIAVPPAVTVIALVVAGCASAPTAPAPGGEPGGAPGRTELPSLGFFSHIKVPDGYDAALRLAGRGVQIFRCEQRADGWQWIFRVPEADLVDGSGHVLVRHGANFSFEHIDGSRLLGTVAAFDESPRGTDLRWLLFSTRSFGTGDLTNITYVQRVNTAGGMPPARCEAKQQNQLLRVDFSADFVFYKAR